MSAEEPKPGESPPNRPWFQFGLRTLLLLFVVLGSSLAVFGAWGIVVFAVIIGIAIYVHEVKSLWSLAYLALTVLCLMCLIGLLALPMLNRAREMAYRPSCLNRLKGIALALHSYHQENRCFPPAYVADKNGKPMHSWRLLILPYMCYDTLYRTCDLTRPWDAPKNKKQLALQLPDFVCPNDPSSNAPGAIQTNYFAVVGPNAAWAGEKPRKLADFGKDASKTILLVEATNSGIPWAEPRDLSLDALGTADGKSPALMPSSNHVRRREEFFFTYDHGTGVCVAMADGSVNFLRTDGRSSEELREILQIGACTEAEIAAGLQVERRLNWPNIAALAVWILSVGALLTRAVRSRKALSCSSN